MQETIYLLIAFLSFCHGQFNAKDYRSSYGQELYNVKNETYSQGNGLLPTNTILQQPQYLPRYRTPFKCRRSGVYADVNDCRKYYECIRTGSIFRPKFVQLVHKCTIRKAFSYIHGICTHPLRSGRGVCIYRWLKKHGSEFEGHQPQNGA
ncbi:Uncharacterized protein DBV15_05441 [Temnothorax longispinosus]|uniref:Chitin-binding type-2 domain-containing protein n=1 Tax=Temnothorax longispinosus TaxID=300112 RepID=A0A4S2KAR7_9HYME|nr:Uncharacterized protein DBV15_05441 [Temnothorax longispinosus]